MKATVDRVVIARARAATARISGMRMSDAGKVKTSLLHPSLVDYWSFKGRGNSDSDRDMIKGIKGNILNAHNFAFGGMSGYGGYTTNFLSNWNNGASVGTLVNPTTLHSSIAGSSLYIYGFGNYNLFADTFKGKITGLPQGYSLYIGYAYNLFKLTDQDGEFTIRKADIPFEPRPDGALTTNGGFKIRTKVTGLDQEIPADITIELLPEYPEAIVLDGRDDYLIFNKPFDIGTVILRYDIIKLGAYDQYLLSSTNGMAYFAYPGENPDISHTNFDMDGFELTGNREYWYGTFDIPKTIDGYLVIGSNTPVEMGGCINIALYDVAVYADSLNDDEILEEITKMQSL